MLPVACACDDNISIAATFTIEDRKCACVFFELHYYARMNTCLGLMVGGLVAAFATLGASGQPWTNIGGNAQRNGLSNQLGPDASTDVLWSGGPTSLISWPPFVVDGRVVIVRQTGFPPSGEPNGSLIHVLNLQNGASQGTISVPFESGDWTTWVAGVRDGRIHASRGGNGASSSAPMYAYDLVTRQQLWATTFDVDAGFYDGVVFTSDGDLIVGSFRTVWRIDGATGQLEWSFPRTCSVSGNCGGVLSVANDAVYVVDTVAGGQTVRKFSLATGVFQYQGPVMSGFLNQNTPLVSPDGTILVPRVQNNTTVDFLFAFRDTGTAIQTKWQVPSAYYTGASIGVGPDSSVYGFAPGNILTRYDSTTGNAISAYPTTILADFLSPQMAIDSSGRVFVSNGGFANGRLYAFTADLQLLWSRPVMNANIGGPSLGEQGTLVFGGNGTQLVALRTARGPTCDSIDFNNDGSLFDPTDVDAFLSVFSEGPCVPDTATCNDIDFNNDGSVFDPCDLDSFLLRFSEGPCTLCGQ